MNRSYAVALLIAALTLSTVSVAKPWWRRGVDGNDTDFLDPDVAYRVSARIDGAVVRVRWAIADGYYLYRTKMSVTAESPDLIVETPTFPHGRLKTDPYLGTQEIFTQQVEATAGYRRTDGGAHPMQIKVTYQGCAEAGLCYLPMTKVIFPTATSPVTHVRQVAWEGYAILGGALAFFAAGLLLRKSRRLSMPA